jgi:hypothetical protein
MRRSQRQGFPARRHEIGAQGEDLLLLLLPTRIRPQLEVVALPHQMHLLFQQTKTRSSGAISTRPAESISSSRAKPTRRRLSRAD